MHFMLLEYLHILLIAVDYTHYMYVLCTYTVICIRSCTLYVHFMYTLLYRMHLTYAHVAARPRSASRAIYYKY